MSLQKHRLCRIGAPRWQRSPHGVIRVTNSPTYPMEKSGKTTLLRNLFSYLPYYSLENLDVRSFAENAY